MNLSYTPWVVYRSAIDSKLLHQHKHNALAAGLTPLKDTEAGVRISEGRFFYDDGLGDVLAGIVRKAQVDLTFAFDWTTMGRLQMTRYQPGGKYDWHVDNDFLLEPTGLQRKWTIVVGISRPGVDFTGGGLELMWTNAAHHEIVLDEGDAVVFPSTLLHRGLPVQTGERWILVAWAQGQGLR